MTTMLPTDIDTNGSTNGSASVTDNTETLQQFGFSDRWNRDRLIYRHGADIRYCTPEKTWLLWNNAYWERDEREKITEIAIETIRALYVEAGRIQDANKDEEEKKRKALAKWAIQSENGKRIWEMIKFARSAVPILPRELDTDPWLMMVGNGTLDLRTGELHTPRREDFITRHTAVPYDPGARSELWETFLERVIPDPEARAFVQRAVGYSLTGDTSEEVMFIIHGPTNSGKSTFVTAIQNVLGDYARQAQSDTLKARSQAGGIKDYLAELAGARLVVNTELEEHDRIATGMLKQITGGDLLRERQLYKASVQFRPQFKLWLSANSRPKLPDDDAAVWRRVREIPFELTIPEDERDKTIKKRLTETDAQAHAAILAWAVRGCLDWQRDGLKAPQMVRVATAAYRNEMDPVRDFFDECCVEGPECKVTADALYTAYEGWATRSGIRHPLPKVDLGRRVGKRPGCYGGVERRGALTVRVWHGIGLIDTTPDES
jgi:putative DNA primase/helicase